MPKYAERVHAASDVLRATPMTEVENLILDHLRHMRSAIDGVREDMREVKTRLGILENQYASMSSRLDRLDARVERIEGGLIWPTRDFSALLMLIAPARVRCGDRE
jgi:predicted  nucleic acid-binding Zn-ribbon protein